LFVNSGAEICPLSSNASRIIH